MKALLVPFPSIGLIFAGRGQVVSGCLATTLGSRLGTNTKLLRGIVGPVSTPNDYLNTVAFAGASDTMPFHGPHGKSLNLLQFSPGV